MLTAVLAPVPEEPLPCGPLDARPNRPVEPILRSLLYRKIHMEDAWQRSRETAPAAGAGATINSPEQRLQQRQANDHYDDFVDVHTDQSSSTDVSGLTSDSPEGSLTEGPVHTQAGAEEPTTTPATSVADQDEPVSDSERSSSSDAAAGSRPTAPGAAPVPTPPAGQQRSNDINMHAGVVRESLLPVSSKIVHFEEAAASSTRPMQQPTSEAQAAFSSSTELPAPADARAAAGAAGTSSRGVAQPSTEQPSSSNSSGSRSRGPTAATAATAQAGASSSEAAGSTNSTSALPPQAVLQLLTDVVLEQARDLRRLSTRVDSFMKQQAKAEQEARDAKVVRQKERLAYMKGEGDRRRKGRRRERQRKVLGVLTLSASLLFWARRRF